ncbi:hypothetical protein KKF84_01460, partial [Myxococcota bacterium]|nr:hypothetical protein [Myxococcota bacterium]
PGYTPQIQFSNRLASDEKTLKKLITVRPAVKDLSIRNYGESIYLYGTFAPAKTYTVSVKRNAMDIYEQRLGANWTGKLKILDATAEMHLPAYRYGVLESKEGKELEVETINNMKAGVVTLVAVKSDDILRVTGLIRDYYWSSGNYSYVGKRYSKFTVPTPKLLEKVPGIPGPATYVPGERVTFVQKFNRKKNIHEKSRINLNKVLKGKGGMVFVQIYSPDLHTNRWSNPYRWVMIQVTNLGITARYDDDRIITLVTDLSTGKPIKNASVTLYKRKNSKDYYNIDTDFLWKGETDAHGTVVAPGIRKKGPKGPYMLVVSDKKQTAFLSIDSYGHDYGYVSSYNWYSSTIPERTTLLSHVFSDRNPYRPGENVKITGILRQRQGEAGARQVVPVDGKDIKVEYVIKDPRGQEVAKGDVPLDSDGVFAVDFSSRPTAMTGYYYFTGKLKGATAIKTSYISLSFQIAAYRAPEHTVTVKTEEGPWYFGKNLKTKITGSYTFGAPMSDAKVEWSLRRYQGYFNPPKNPGFSFYVTYQGRMVDGQWKYPAYSKLVKEGKGTLNDKGVLEVAPPLEQGKGIDKLHGPGSFILEATVYDVNRQAIAGRSTTLVHLSDLYLGLKPGRSYIKAGEKVKVSFVAVNHDGKRIPAKSVTVTAYLRESKEKKVKSGRYYSSRWITEETRVGSCKGTTGAEPGSCEILFKKGGYYTLKGTLKDDKGRQVESHSGIYVYGKDAKLHDKNKSKSIVIRADKNKYEIGDTATIHFTSPFKDAVGLYAVEQGGIITWKNIQFKGTSHTEKVKITQGSLPNFYVSMVLVRGRVKPEKGSKEPDSGRPKFAHGRQSIT